MSSNAIKGSNSQRDSRYVGTVRTNTGKRLGVGSASASAKGHSRNVNEWPSGKLPDVASMYTPFLVEMRRDQSSCVLQESAAHPVGAKTDEPPQQPAYVPRDDTPPSAPPVIRPVREVRPQPANNHAAPYQAAAMPERSSIECCAHHQHQRPLQYQQYGTPQHQPVVVAMPRATNVHNCNNGVGIPPRHIWPARIVVHTYAQHTAMPPGILATPPIIFATPGDFFTEDQRKLLYNAVTASIVLVSAHRSLGAPASERPDRLEMHVKKVIKGLDSNKFASFGNALVTLCVTSFAIGIIFPIFCENQIPKFFKFCLSLCNVPDVDAKLSFLMYELNLNIPIPLQAEQPIASTHVSKLETLMKDVDYCFSHILLEERTKYSVAKRKEMLLMAFLEAIKTLESAEFYLRKFIGDSKGNISEDDVCKLYRFMNHIKCETLIVSYVKDFLCCDGTS